jgi:FkbM family methyltransferase
MLEIFHLHHGLRKERNMYDRRLIAKCLKGPKYWPRVAKVFVAKILAMKTVVVRADGVTLEGGTKNGQGLWCLVAGVDYEEELGIWLEALRPGDVVLDVGANIGVYSIRAGKRVGPNGRVLAFEPLPAALDKLKRNIYHNNLNNITVLELAVGDYEGEATLYEGERQSSASFFRSTCGPSHNVQVRTIDSVVNELHLMRVDWVKMDIEGAEATALAGMEETLIRFSPSILFENGDSAKDCITFLHRQGYLIGQYDRRMTWHNVETGSNLFARPSLVCRR